MSALWTNILIILVLGVIFIIASGFISRKVATADDYILGKNKLGVAFGITSLLALWINGNTLMAAPEGSYGMGVIGAIGYSFFGAIGILAFAPLSRRIHEVIPNGRTVGDFIKNRFGKKNYILFLIVLFAYSIGLIMTQGIGGGLLLEQTFQVPYEIAVILTFLVCTVYATMGGFSSVTGLAFFQTILIFLVVIVVPPLVYFNVGVTPVYEGMLQVDPTKLDLLLPAGLLFMFAGSFMSMGMVFVDNTFWQRAYALPKNKVVSVFSLSSIGWFFVPLAAATIAFVAIATQRAPEQINQVAPYIAELYGGNIVNWIFLVGVWSALASTIAALLNSLVSLILNDVVKPLKPNMDAKSMLKLGRIFTIIFGLLGILISLPKLLTMLNALMFLGIITAAFIFPVTYGLFWKKLNPNMSFVAALLAIICGYITYYTVGDYQGLAVSGWVSFIICVVGSHVFPANFDWDVLRKVGKNIEARGEN